MPFLGSFFVPAKRLTGGFFRTRTGLIAESKFVFCLCISSLCCCRPLCFLIALKCLGLICLDTTSVLVAVSQMVQSAGVAFLCRFHVPHSCTVHILCYTVAHLITESNAIHSICHSMICRCQIPVKPFFCIFRHSNSIQQAVAIPILCFWVSLLGSSCKAFYCLLFVIPGWYGGAIFEPHSQSVLRFCVTRAGGIYIINLCRIRVFFYFFIETPHPILRFCNNLI